MAPAPSGQRPISATTHQMPITADERRGRPPVVVIHDHRPIGPDLPLMAAGGVAGKVYQIALDVDLQAGYEVSRDRREGWLGLAARGMAAAPKGKTKSPIGGE